MTDAPNDIFPITEVEAEMLHGLGWESGFGWYNQFDWYKTPSAGPIIFVEDAADLMALFLEDLTVYRTDVAKREARERLNEAAPDLLEALEGLLAALAMGPLEIAAAYGPDAHPDEPVIDAAHKARAVLSTIKQGE